MDIWNVLGITRTSDARAIKSAYARQLKLHSPESDPEGFMLLRQAYESAQKWLDDQEEDEAAFQKVEPEDQPAPQNSAHQQIAILQNLLDEEKEREAAQTLQAMLQTLKGASIDDFSDFEEELVVALAKRDSLSPEFLHFTLYSLGWGFNTNKFISDSIHAHALTRLQRWFEHHVISRTDAVFACAQEKGNESAVELLEHIYRWPLFDTVETRAIFQSYFIYRFMQLERWPMTLLQSVAEKYQWRADENPFNESSRHHAAFDALMKEYLLYKNRRTIFEKAKAQCTPLPPDVLQILFEKFDKEKVSQLSSTPALRNATTEILEITRQLDLPESQNPIDLETRNFWAQEMAWLTSRTNPHKGGVPVYADYRAYMVMGILSLLIFFTREFNAHSHAPRSASALTNSSVASERGIEKPRQFPAPNINLEFNKQPPPNEHATQDYAGENTFIDPVDTSMKSTMRNQASRPSVQTHPIEMTTKTNLSIDGGDLSDWYTSDRNRHR